MWRYAHSSLTPSPLSMRSGFAMSIATTALRSRRKFFNDRKEPSTRSAKKHRLELAAIERRDAQGMFPPFSQSAPTTCPSSPGLKCLSVLFCSQLKDLVLCGRRAFASRNPGGLPVRLPLWSKLNRKATSSMRCSSSTAIQRNRCESKQKPSNRLNLTIERTNKELDHANNR